MAVFIDNPLIWSHIRLRGGWKNIAITSGGYALAVAIGITLITQLASARDRTSMMAGCTHALLVFQTLILVVFGFVRVNAAVKADVTSKLLESHRLMPVSALAAVVGYILGATSQAVAMAAVNFVAGLFTAAGSGLPVELWVSAHAILLAFALLCWTFAALGGLGGGAGAWAFLVLLGMLMTGGGLGVLVPGLTLLISPLIGRSIFVFRTGMADLGLPYILAFVSQGLFGAILLAAACRRYRRAEQPAFGVALSLLLLAVGAVISLTAIHFWDEVQPAIAEEWDMPYRAQFIITMVVMLVLGFLPTTTAARQDGEWLQHRTLGDVALPRRPISPVLVVLLAAGICMTLCFMPPDVSPRGLGFGSARAVEAVGLKWRIIGSGMVAVFSLMSVMYLSRWVYLVVPRAMLLLIFWFFMAWAIPILIDLVLFAWRDVNGKDFEMGQISGLSPIGAITVLWSASPRQATAGLVVQAALALATAAIYWFYTPRITLAKVAGTELFEKT